MVERIDVSVRCNLEKTRSDSAAVRIDVCKLDDAAVPGSRKPTNQANIRGAGHVLKQRIAVAFAYDTTSSRTRREIARSRKGADERGGPGAYRGRRRASASRVGLRRPVRKPSPSAKSNAQQRSSSFILVSIDFSNTTCQYRNFCYMDAPFRLDPSAAEYPPNSPKKHRWPKIRRKKCG